MRRWWWSALVASIVAGTVVLGAAPAHAVAAPVVLTDLVDTIAPATSCCGSGSTTLTTVASGDPKPTILWERSTDGGATWTAESYTGVGAAGANWTSSLTIWPSLSWTGRRYRATWTNSEGSATTHEMTLLVSALPTVTTQPVTQEGDPGAVVTFTSVGSGGPPPTQQWQTQAYGSTTWVDVPGATGTSIEVEATAEQTGRSYRSVFTQTPYGGGATRTATSNAAVLRVRSAPVVIVHPQPTVVKANASVTLTADARGWPAPTRSWERSTDGGATWSPVSTSTSYTFTASAGLDGARHRVTFTNTYGAATSDEAEMRIGSGPTVTAAPASTSAEVGATASFSVGSAGYPAPSVQWQRLDATASTWSAIAGATEPTLDLVVDATMHESRLRAVLTNQFGTATSAEAVLTLPSAARVATPPPDALVALGDPVAFTVGIVAGADPTTVRWQRRASGATAWTDVDGATDATYGFVPTLADHASSYRAVVSSPSGGSVSAPATLTVAAAPTITADPQPATSTYPTNRATFTVGATGTPTLARQWQRSTDGGTTWANTSSVSAIPGVLEVVVTGPSMDGWQYRAIVTNTYGSATSTPAALSVRWPPAITTQPVATTVVAGSPATFTVVASGLPAPTYQWQRGPSVGGACSCADIAGATGPTLTIPTATAADGGKLYRVVVANGSGTVTSSAVALTVQTSPTFTTNPVDRTVRTGATASWSVAAVANPAPTYRWQLSRDEGTTWNDIAGATSTTYARTAAVGDDRVLVRAVATNVVASVPSSPARLRVDDQVPAAVALVVPGAAPTFGVQPGPVSVEVTATDDVGVASIRWSSTGAQVALTTTVAGDRASIPVSAAGTTTVTYQAVDATGRTSPSATIVVVLDPRPVVSVAPQASALEPDDGGTRSARFQLSLSSPAPADVTVWYHTEDATAVGCATKTCDYVTFGTAAKPRSVVIKAGTTTAALSVPVVADGLVEADETFDLVIDSTSSTAVLGSATRATATIADAAALGHGTTPVLTMTPVNDVVEGDGGTVRAQAAITLSRPLAVPLSVTYLTVDGTAVAGFDYRAVRPTTVVLAAGTVSRTIDVAITPNLAADGDRSFQVVLQPVVAPPGQPLVDLGVAASIRIVDDEVGA